jgi:hypothetical protein
MDFDKPNTLEDTINKERYCYDKFKHKEEPHKDWKKKSKLRFHRKGLKP